MVEDEQDSQTRTGLAHVDVTTGKVSRLTDLPSGTTSIATRWQGLQDFPVIDTQVAD
ncbi:hypothetical protein D3C85_1650880 [compost metagenome]